MKQLQREQSGVIFKSSAEQPFYLRIGLGDIKTIGFHGTEKCFVILSD